MSQIARISIFSSKRGAPALPQITASSRKFDGQVPGNHIGSIQDVHVVRGAGMDINVIHIVAIRKWERLTAHCTGGFMLHS